MADDNRVLKAWDDLTPEQQGAMLQRWGSEKAWYLCKYTNTIATGLRDGYDASELARHYKIPLDAVKLAREVAKGSVIPDGQKTETKETPEKKSPDLPPGAVQGPLTPPPPPETPSGVSDKAISDIQEAADKEAFDSVPEETEEEPEPPKKKAKKRGRPRKKKKEPKKEEPKKEKKPEPKQEESEKTPKPEKKSPAGPPPLHPNAQVADWVREGKKSGSESKSSGDVPFHPNAQVNPMPGQKPKKAPPAYEKSESYSAFKDRENR